MENQLLEINRDLMTYEGKINHSAKTQKMLTKPAWELEKRGHLGGGDKHPVLGCNWTAVGQRRSPTWPVPTVTAACLQYQRVADPSIRGSELFSLTEVVMIHLLMEALGLGKKQGEDATWRGHGRATLWKQQSQGGFSRLKPSTKLT